MIETLIPSGSLILELAGISCITAGGVMYSLRNIDSKEKIIKDFFKNTGLYIKDGDNEIYPELVDQEQEEKDQELFIYSIPNGLTVKDFENKKEALEHQLDGELELWAKGNALYIRLYSADLPDRAEFKEEKDYILQQVRKANLGLSVGFSRRGYIVNDFSNATCHIVLGGETGAGKSVLLRQAIISGMLAYSHHELEFYFVDLKGGVEMTHFRKAAHTKKIAETETDVINMLQKLNSMVDDRLQLLKRRGVTSIYQIENLKKPKILLVVDELAELQNNDDCIEQLERLLRLARATGIHLVTATQRPDANVLPGQLKANLPVSVAMKTKNDINSDILLDNPEAAYLEPVPGRGIYQLNQNVKIQVPYLSPETAQELIKQRNDVLNYNQSETQQEVNTARCEENKEDSQPISWEFKDIENYRERKKRVKSNRKVTGKADKKRAKGREKVEIETAKKGDKSKKKVREQPTKKESIEEEDQQGSNDWGELV